MTAAIKFAASRCGVHACLLAAAFATQSLAAQAPEPPPPAAETPVVEVARAQVRQAALQKHAPAARSASARGAIRSVAAAARCIEGYVVNGQQRASASDVRIVAAERADCDAGRCRSYQVTAARDSEQPFDLEVSVTCS